MDPFAVISFKSFDSIWYWIMMAAVWSAMCHWTLGVPYDGIMRAQRMGGAFARSVDELVVIHTQRLVDVMDRAGVLVLGVTCFFVAILATFGFGYGYELAQALFVMIVPLLAVLWLNLRLAFRLHATMLTGVELQKTLLRRRFWNQVIGLSSIILAAIVALVHFARQFIWY